MWAELIFDRINKINRIEGRLNLDRRDMNYMKNNLLFLRFAFMSFMFLLSKFRNSVRISFP